MANNKISKVIIRMYHMGTGDCFALKFIDQNGNVSFKMMIDAGVCRFTKVELVPYMEDLLDFVNDEVDILVVTHEHFDHNMAFQYCKDLFKARLKPKKIWFGWTEDDSNDEVKKWKKDYGEKKFALHKATEKINQLYKNLSKSKLYAEHPDSSRILGILNDQREVVQQFTDLAVSEGAEIDFAAKYVGDQAGMKVVKEGFGRNDVDFQYHYPGNIIEDFTVSNGIKFYVLGPPEVYDDVALETGGDGESYGHSQNNQQFNLALMNAVVESSENTSPFEDHYHMSGSGKKALKEYKNKYLRQDWRRIDHDWILQSAGFSLRMNSLTNNLSLALAIEIVHTGEVLLFPGDAEYGSWASWHKIEWDTANNDTLTTEDLLKRTILYKVAHHMSHNGTAQRLGLNMMTNKKLTALVPLSYEKIYSSWKNTMPNRFILEELMNKTKGRIIMNSEKGMRYKGQSVYRAIRDQRKTMTASDKKTFDKNTTKKKYAHEHIIEFET